MSPIQPQTPTMLSTVPLAQMPPPMHQQPDPNLMEWENTNPMYCNVGVGVGNNQMVS